MPVTIPPAVNYPSPLNAVPTKYLQDPPEGAKLINIEIDWATMGGSGNCVSINLQNNAVLAFSQIVALSVDNSSCGSDVLFVFPDTMETTLIPAFSPKTIVPVFTNQTQFFCIAQGEEPIDITRFSILNTLPPPIALPTTQEQNTANSAALDGTTIGTTPIVPAGVTGTLESFFLNWYAAGPASGSWQVVDGTGAIVFAGQASGGNNDAASGQPNVFLSQAITPLLQVPDCKIRFRNGLNFKVIATSYDPTHPATEFVQEYQATVLYRMP